MNIPPIMAENALPDLSRLPDSIKDSKAFKELKPSVQAIVNDIFTSLEMSVELLSDKTINNKFIIVTQSFINDLNKTVGKKILKEAELEKISKQFIENIDEILVPLDKEQAEQRTKDLSTVLKIELGLPETPAETNIEKISPSVENVLKKLTISLELPDSHVKEFTKMVLPTLNKLDRNKNVKQDEFNKITMKICKQTYPLLEKALNSIIEKTNLMERSQLLKDKSQILDAKMNVLAHILNTHRKNSKGLPKAEINEINLDFLHEYGVKPKIIKDYNKKITRVLEKGLKDIDPRNADSLPLHYKNTDKDEKETRLKEYAKLFVDTFVSKDKRNIKIINRIHSTLIEFKKKWIEENHPHFILFAKEMELISPVDPTPLRKKQNALNRYLGHIEPAISSHVTIYVAKRGINLECGDLSPLSLSSTCR